mmetsp:Transcript_3077/g.7348  ORF Transcript_3077/g.7348 Transcript_3077/m.7348 type:complete len:219 (-) Transcript_3077:780-1436(-)
MDAVADCARGGCGTACGGGCTLVGAAWWVCCGAELRLLGTWNPYNVFASANIIITSLPVPFLAGCKMPTIFCCTLCCASHTYTFLLSSPWALGLNCRKFCACTELTCLPWNRYGRTFANGCQLTTSISASQGYFAAVCGAALLLKAVTDKRNVAFGPDGCAAKCGIFAKFTTTCPVQAALGQNLCSTMNSVDVAVEAATAAAASTRLFLATLPSCFCC